MKSSLPEDRNTSFRGDVLRLVSGTGIGQIIALLAAPVIARLYPPSAFGVAAVFASFGSIFGVMACLRYELSIVLPETDREGANLFALSVGLSLATALLTGLVLALAGEEIAGWINMPEIRPYLWLVPVTVLLHGLFIALNYWNTRTKHFTRLSIARVTQQVAGTSITLGAGFAGYATGGVMIGAGVAGQGVATATLGGQIWRDNGKFIRDNVHWRGVVEGLRRYKNFPMFSSWSALLNTASWQLPALMLSAFFSSAVVGFYALGFRILQMPMTLIGRAISQVFLQRAAVERVAGNLGSLVETLFQRLLITSLLPGLILMLTGADLFRFVFGSEWTEAGVYTQILAPWAIIWFISSPLSTIYTVLEKQSKEPGLQALIFVVRFVGLGIGGYLGDARLAILFFTIGGILAYAYLIKKIFEFCGLSAFRVVGRTWPIIAVAAVFILPLLAVKILGLDGLPLLLLAGVTALAYFLKYRKRLLGVRTV